MSDADLERTAYSLAGYRPGALAQVVQLHMDYYGPVWKFGRAFETKVAGELAEFLARTDEARDLFLSAYVPDACANIVMNPRKPVARYLTREELQRLGAVLDRHRQARPWKVAAIRLLTLTGARLSEVLGLKWGEIGELGKDGASARLEDSKTGPRTVWLGPDAARLLAELPRPEGRERVFPEDLTPDRLYTFWVGIREKAGLPGLRIHDCRHTWASQGVMNGVGLTTVGRLLGHRQRETTAIYAHLDDRALQDAAAQAASVIARAMGYKVEPQSMSEDIPKKPDGDVDRSSAVRERAGDRATLMTDPFAPPTTTNQPGRSDRTEPKDKTEKSPQSTDINWL